ncbi:hybrid sensor histidine kinase/response regulator transcription factor [Flagellimonas pacifica]|uniref:histidine kinase n=1 Tax=Flagellimonas pacifica TaxID=1247520 RepID=A0A285MTB0_9FLAO|nr:response regulator [Allomuricauda parva]SNZ00425.1 His Kinase A (phospho-acceptor) domain-containing protein [Allomuricauda parva]
MKYLSPFSFKTLTITLALVMFGSAGMQMFGQDQGNFKSLVPSHNNKQFFVSNIAQGALGNIWMSAINGILIYNGYSFSLIDNKSIFPTIQKDDRIDFIINDNSKNIWIITRDGLLAKYDAQLGQFERFNHKLKKSIEKIRPNGKQVWMASKEGIIYKYHNQKFDSITTIPNINMADNTVNNLDFDKNDNVYVGTTKGKIYKYSVQSGRQTEIIGPFTDYPGGIVLKMDSENRLWIGTEANGLHIYDIAQQKIISGGFFKGDIENLSSSLFLNLYLDGSKNIWAGTDGNGLYKIDSKTGQVKVFKKNYFDEFSIESNTILDVSEDNHKNIWLVTKYGNLNIIPNTNKNINYHTGSENNIPMRVLSVLKARDKSLWIGTDGAGLTRIGNNGMAKQYFNDAKNNFYVQSMIEDDKADLLFGTYRNGLWHHSSNTNTFKALPVKNSKGQIAKDIRVLYKDSKNRIWVGSNVSLNIYDSNQKLLATFGNNENGLQGVIAESITEDKTGTLWIGQYNGGLFKFIENNDNIEHSFFENFKADSKENISRVISMSPGGDDKIWLIDEHNKLATFNTQTNTFSNFEHIGAIRDFNFIAINYIDKNNIWASIYNAIVHLDSETQTTEIYYSSDGLPNGNFMSNSTFKDSDGQLYFGNTKGVTYFYPHELTKTPSNPKLMVYDIEVLNKPAKDLLPKQIKSEVFNLNNLDLAYNQSSFSIRFAAIDNILNHNYSYSYKLIGFDDEWKNSYTEGLATYTNVPPGKYTLEIKGHEMNDLSKSFGKTIAISIAQPFWNKPLAHIIYGTFLVLLAFGIIKWYRLRKKLLINKIIRTKEQDLHNAKIDFFTKMSHEIQTPITLILGPIEDMLKRAELNGNMLLKERLNIISNNAGRLSRIARELTLIRNKEASKLRLLVSRNNLYLDITSICMSFKEIARNKQIDFSINCPKNLNNAWYDKEKLEHILYNLLSNAFKYTPVEGNVQLSVSPIVKKSIIKISVSDSGQGIQKDELDKIFKIFYRSGNNRKAKGAGIGLALTKELVTLHKGKIKVHSIPNEGTTFTIKIPIAEKSYKDEEKIAIDNQKTETKLNDDEKTLQEPITNSGRKSILIVEDNFELQQFLKELLSSQYNILLADNGEEGFYHAKNNVPDLIISDIMMPQMDGIEMCKELNKHNLTKHIPIVLLTAKNSTKAKIEGLKTGAVEFINKPFNTKELLLKVNNILLSKEHIISKYRKELINRPQFSQSKSQDEIFLENLVTNINKHIKDPEFKVQQLAESLNMSYSSLYRKCLNVTGVSVIDFTREIRLKKGAVLLVKFGYSISEAAHLVGFNDPKYFSKSFKNQFGTTPKDFKKSADTEENIEKYLSKYHIDSTI